MPLMSPVSMHLHIFEQYLVDEDWCMPYFLVPKEHELLGHTKWPLIERCIPEWLEAAAEVLLRSVRGERVVDTAELRQVLEQIKAERESAALSRNYSKATEETKPSRRFNQYLDEDEYMWQEGDAEDWPQFEYTAQETEPFALDLETEEDDDEPEELMFSSGDEQEEVDVGHRLNQMWARRPGLDKQENAKINALKYIIIRQDQASIYPSQITPDLLIQPQGHDSKPLQQDDPDKATHTNQPEVVLSPAQAEFLLLQRHPKLIKEAPATVNLLKDVQLRPAVPTLAIKPASPASKSAAAEELAEVLARRLQRLSRLELEKEIEDQNSRAEQVDYAGDGKRLMVEGVKKPAKEASEKRLSPFGARESFLPGLLVKVSEDELSEEDFLEICEDAQLKDADSMDYESKKSGTKASVWVLE
uniref:Uncharacterized protein n=1 Tax=Ditylenchus dipsaci TaxID=166011 RepID=A0A915ET21_9BILA